ncbi:hypothetical protein CYMTET_2847 [Cymbomonas tetramitiformis]|uniref:Ubiquitin-like protease family profile domain-containing protein n=1 Tax=Cymbomonas tetramitiformis TaxID=36881 RepID=A0AAE0H4D6_9CHLO|nr:hypothetical protein CYMTET_2847 [Cymbomonas tetramitiformis]
MRAVAPRLSFVEESNALVDLTGLEDSAKQSVGVGDALTLDERRATQNIISLVRRLRRKDRDAPLVRYALAEGRGDGYVLTMHDFFRLLSRKWLNDTLIDAYLTLLRGRGGAVCFLYTYVWSLLGMVETFEPVRRERMFGRFFDDAKYTHYFVPVLIGGNHWVSLILDTRSAVAHVYDPLRANAVSRMEHFSDRVGVMMDLHEKRYDARRRHGVVMRSLSRLPKQTNQVDCGVFSLALANALYHAGSCETLRLGTQIERYGRRKLASQLRNCRVDA